MNKNLHIFSERDKLLFLLSGVLILSGYCCMAFDPVENGFGILTLTIAPLLLLSGFLLPIAGIIGSENVTKFFHLHSFQHYTREHIGSLIIFCVAFTTYIITLEPTASLWDCGEFIASAYKLQVPHTPGTPLTLLFGRLFTMLAFGDVQKVAFCMNLMSAFFSALSVFLVFHLIIYFANKISSDRISNILAACCGSLTLTFSDTFWFSAVEAETYGIACFFLLLILYMIVKGKDQAEPLKSRCIILIGYLSALAYCIHPMCVLVLPVLPFLWYVHNRELTFRSVVLTVLVGLVIVFSINKFVAIGLFELAFKIDLLFVNSFSLPFYSGAIFLIVAIIFAFYLLLSRFRSYAAYTWAVVFLLLGFLPYLMLFIRSNHNPPIDETNPEDLAMIKAYMNRESYPSSPLMTGPYFDADITDVNVSGKAYYKTKDKYKVAGNLVDYSFENLRTTILPRLYSRDPDHISAYRQWLGLKPHEKPTFTDNLRFMFEYQIGNMYLRYLMWNFVGRESDIQNSSWLKPWDRLAVEGDSKSRNQYWMIPLLLGICGAFVQLQYDRKGFFANLIFFLITGLILAVYLNSPPVEPRERDYIYVASYIAFCVWIGLGVLILRHNLISSKFKLLAIGVITTSIPTWIAYQNFDDHNRSGRTFQMDYSRNLLNSCAPNAILFTGGDNDTFPLWYLQDVEGVRPDVRVVVLSYFNTDWYINQLRRQYYESKPFKLTLTEKDYRQYGMNDVLYLDEKIKEPVDVAQFLELLKNEHPALKRFTANGDSYHILPSRQLKITVDDSTIPYKSAALLKTPELNISVEGNFLQKNALAVLDVIVSNKWERPVYFNFTSLNTLGLEVAPYAIDEGLVYRLGANRNPAESGTIVDTDKMYENLIRKGNYSNLQNKDVFFNYEDFHLRMIVPLRQSFNTLAAALLEKGDSTKSREVLNHAFEKLYGNHLSTAFVDIYTADMLLSVGETDKAKKIALKYFNSNIDSFTNAMRTRTGVDRAEVYFLSQAAELLQTMGYPQYMQQLQDLN